MEFSGLNHKSWSFILLINVKMPTIFGILTFMSRINSMLSGDEHEKSFITSGPDQTVHSGSATANIIASDEPPHTSVSHLGLFCLLTEFHQKTICKEMKVLLFP